MRKFGATAVLALLAFFWGAGVAIPQASAASGDKIDTLRATYTVQPNGSVAVQETIAYRFAPGRHRGITRSLVVREPYTGNQNKDRVYSIKVKSIEASPKVSTRYTVEDAAGGGSERSARKVIRIGDQNTYFNDSVVTYTLNYEISRTVISGPGGDEFYWDVVAPEFPPIASAEITVKTPSAVKEVSCYIGATKSTERCASASKPSDQESTYSQTNLGEGIGMTVGTVFTPGAVTNNTPELADSASAKFNFAPMLSGIFTAISAAASGVIGWIVFRARGRDDRFMGMAPGTVPGAGMEATIGRDNIKEIPVAFAPPKIAPEEAGLVMDGDVDVRDTTAAILEMATRGGVQLGNQDGQYYATLINSSVAVRPHQRQLLDDLFGHSAVPGTTVDLSQAGSMATAHQNLTTALRAEADNYGWYKRMPTGSAAQMLSLGSVFVFGAVLFFVFGKHFSSSIWLLFLPVVPILIAMFALRRFFVRGQRSATGRAVADQIEGFRIYLTTAEADQIKFEEGEDIFSKYLPWATIYGVADRWTKICQQLVDMGRLSDEQPSWYVGYWPGFYGFNVGGLTSTLDTASTIPSSGSSDGSGGFSSGGGGFSGGGGGGGDIGSW